MRYCSIVLLSLMLVSNGALAVSASFSHPDPQAIRVVVEPNPAFEDEEVSIRLISSGRHTQLDLGRIKDDFDLLGRRGSSQSRIVNGKTESTYETILIVRPKRTGTLTVPRMRLNGRATKPTTLEVKKRPKAAGSAEEVFLKTLVQPQTVYVGQQVMIRQQLHARSNITSGELSTPALDSAVIERIGDDRRFSTIVDGVRYNVIERVYAAFPESAGNLTVDGGRFSGEVDAGTASFGVFRNTRRVQSAAGQTKLIVNSPPTAARGHWLPASAVKASVELLPADAELRVGEPVTLKFQLIADGILGSALPQIRLEESQQFSAYVEPGQHETQGNASGITGKRELSVALIPLEEGKLTFPAMDIPWWDVINDKQQVARIESLVFDVLPSADAKPIPAAPTGEAAAKEVTGDAPPPASGIAIREIVAWALTLLFATLWVVTLFMLRRRPAEPVAALQCAQQFKAVSLYEVNKVLQQGDIAAASTAICGWASSQLNLPISSLPQAAKQLASHAADRQNGQQIADRLNAMDAARFGDETPGDIEQLLVDFKAWRKGATLKSNQGQNLPGLY